MVGISILVISLAICLAVGGLVVLRGVHDKITIIYAVATVFFLILCSANYLAVESESHQLLLVRIVMMSATVSAYLFYALIAYLRPTPRDQSPYRTILFYVTVIIAALDFSPFLFSGIIVAMPPRPLPGPGVVLFFGHLLLVVGLALYRLIVSLEHPRSKDERAQSVWLIVGSAPVLFLAPLTSFILPNLVGARYLVTITPLYVVLFVLCVGYAIIRHRLFDIKAAAIRTVTYGLSLAVLAAAYYVLAYAVSTILLKGQASSQVSVNPINIVLALILAFIFQPVKRFFDHVTNAVFYRNGYSLEDFYGRLSSALAVTTDLRNLLYRASHEISRSLKADQVFFVVQYNNHTQRMIAGTEHHSLLPEADIETINSYVTTQGNRTIVTDQLQFDQTLRRLLLSHRIALLLPLCSEKTIIGYLMLGDQKTGGYTNRDIKALRTISDELSIAIQNAVSVQTVKELNDSLQLKINNATKELRRSNAQLRKLDESKDEFLSMASHQLRTPLTSIKGYLDMLLEGDAGRLTKNQRQFISQAYLSSERMVHLIADFLNISRVQTGRFTIEVEPVDLAKLVQQELDGIKTSAEQHNLTFSYQADKAIPKLLLDESKIRQVVMNFADNAIYYSKPHSTIKVSLVVEQGEIVLRFTDTGIGVPLDEQPHLFTKFYRAKNARTRRPDGTGVGLYLAKKIIVDHGGSIVFKSVENQGSTFGFRLPIERLRAPVNETDYFDNTKDN